jgi:hypothetical protein
MRKSYSRLNQINQGNSESEEKNSQEREIYQKEKKINKQRKHQ